MTAIAHILGIQVLVDLIVHALHLHGVRHLNVDGGGAHHAWIETRHWLIAIRWKG